MLRRQSEALFLHLERAGDRVGSSKIVECTDYWQGECSGRGWWWRESKESNMPPCRPECTKTSKKTGSFAHVLAYKSLKMLFLAQSYLTRYTPEMLYSTCSMFQKSYTPTAARIRVNGFLKPVHAAISGFRRPFVTTPAALGQNLQSFEIVFIGAAQQNITYILGTTKQKKIYLKQHKLSNRK